MNSLFYLILGAICILVGVYTEGNTDSLLIVSVIILCTSGILRKLEEIKP